GADLRRDGARSKQLFRLAAGAADARGHPGNGSAYCWGARHLRHSLGCAAPGNRSAGSGNLFLLADTIGRAAVLAVGATSTFSGAAGSTRPAADFGYCARPVFHGEFRESV